MSIHSVLSATRHWVNDNIFRSNDGRDYGTEMTSAQQTRLVAAGASGGAVIGGIAGGIAGTMTHASDSVKEVWVNRTINDPKMNGYSEGHSEIGHYDTYYTTETDSDGHSHEVSHSVWHHDGWRYYFSPNIEQRPVGSYTEPTLQHSKPINLLSGALGGALIGGVAGTVAGVGAAALLHWARSGDDAQNGAQQRGAQPNTAPQPARVGAAPREDDNGGFFHDTLQAWREAEPGTRLKISTSAAGAAVGGVAGFLAGQSQAAHQTVITRTYPVPDLVSRDLGRIPNDFSTYDWGWNSWFPPSHTDGDHGWHEVYRDAPQYDGGGKPMMKPYTETISSKQFGPVLGTMGGIAIGAGIGFLSGVAIDVAMHFKDAPEGARN